jgi:hypothetical protein
MSDPGQDKDAGPREAERCTPEELFEHGGPVFQLFAELVEGACKASGIPGYAIIALAPNGGMASINGGSDEEARTLCGRLVPRYKPLPPPGFEPSRPPRTSAVLRLLRSVRRLFLG